MSDQSEPSYAGEHAGAHRAPCEGLDFFDERIAGIDVDACIAIGEGGFGGGFSQFARPRRRGKAQAVAKTTLR